MNFRTMIAPMTAIAPLALLAACGGSGSEEAPATTEAASTAEAMPSEAAPSEAAPVTTTAAATTEAVVDTAPPAIATPTPITPVGTTEVAAAAPPMTPPAAFAVCKACHSVQPGKNGVGPSLHAIVGTKAGDVAGYPFSPALKKSGITWDRASLDTWLQGPMKMVPGTKMVISVPDAAKRKAIIDYLESLK